MHRPKRYGINDPEINDGIPVEMPMGACRPTPLNELIARMVQSAISAEKGDEFETMDEANDFDEEDDMSLLDMSPYTLPAVDEEYPIEEDPEEEPPTLSPKEVLDRAYGAGNYPAEWAQGKTGDTPNPDESEPGKP